MIEKNNKKGFILKGLKMYKKLIILILFICLPQNVYAETISAESAAVIEMTSRRIVYGKEHKKRMPMASTTKIMTAALALEYGNSEDFVTVSVYAQNQEGSSIYLRAGDKVRLIDLLYGLMLNSGNDAAVAIAEHISGSEEKFVELMNEKAKELGCTDTRFSNASGLNNEQHYSTAYDMAVIMAYAMENDEFRKIISSKEYQIVAEGATTYLRNHNKLLWQYDSCIGGKTGFTKASGRCLVSCAQKNGIEVVAVTLNDADDWHDHKTMCENAFKKLERKEVLTRGGIVCTKTIRNTRVNLLAGDNAEVAWSGNAPVKLVCKVYLKENINDDIKIGEEVGRAKIYSGRYCVAEVPLVSGQKVPNYAGKFSDSLGSVIRHFLLK